MEKKKIVIAGAGLVGSLLAVMFKKRGHQVTIYEKRPDMRMNSVDGGRSINLIVTSRGINALQTVNLWEKVKEITVPVSGRMIHARDGELTFQAYGRNQTECNYSISRGKLNKLLMTEAESIGVEIQFSEEVVNVDFEQKRAFLNSGYVVHYDLLFGTDGGGSKVRRALHQKVPGAKEEVRRLNCDYKEMLMPANSDGNYPIDKNALHIWPRGAEMLMALPNQDGSFTMTLYMSDEKFQEVNDEATLETYFEEYYPDAIPLMPDYKKEYFDNPQGMLATLFAAPWSDGDSVALLGDAAHAIVPFFGQGMNSGFEDCYYLMKFIDELGWETGLAKYSEFQKPNGDAIANMAIENFYEMAEKVGDKNFLLKKKIEKKIEEHFPDKYRARYGMVTYTLCPYDLVYRAGKIQADVIDKIVEGMSQEEELDLIEVEKLLAEKYWPFIEKYNVNINRFQE